MTDEERAVIEAAKAAYRAEVKAIKMRIRAQQLQTVEAVRESQRADHESRTAMWVLFDAIAELVEAEKGTGE